MVGVVYHQIAVEAQLRGSGVPPLAPQVRGYPGAQLVYGEGLDHVVVAAGGKALYLVALLHPGREEDDGAGDIFAYPAADFQPVHVGHVHVQQYGVRPLLGLTHGLLA